MRHEISIKGDAFRLRPVELSDTQFIVDLRSDPERTKYLHAISPRVEDQEAYIREYFNRQNDYYFMVENLHDSKLQGTISIYNVDTENKCGEFGRWILSRNSMAAVESAFLLYQVAFDILGLDMVYTRTIADNKKIVSFHEACGLKLHNVIKDHFDIGGTFYDAVEQRVTRDMWGKMKAELAKKANQIARMVTR